MSLWENAGVVVVGSGIGGGARFLIYSACAHFLPFSRVPVGTLAVNVLGSFLIAFIGHIALTTTLIGAEARLFLTVGVMGGLTTYSSFNNDVIEALRAGRMASAAIDVVSTVVLCLVAGFLGLIAARALVRG